MVPRDFYELHRFVTLTEDVMFVSGIPFLVTLSGDIKIISAEFLPSRTAKQLSISLTKIVKVYTRGGCIVRLVVMDMEFVKIKHFDKMEVNTTAVHENVGEMEQGIRLVKEQS